MLYYSSGRHAFHYKFNIDSNVWTKLPNNINSKVKETHCVKVDLPDGGAGVMLVGGTRYVYPLDSEFADRRESRNVEILNLSSLMWEEKDSFDERWIQTTTYNNDELSFYSFLYLDDKPTLIGRFDDKDKNVMEQYDIAEDTWSLEYFDMTDAPCGANYPCMQNFVNIPAEFFPACY